VTGLNCKDLLQKVPYRTLRPSVRGYQFSSGPMDRRLTDRIKELCAKAVSLPESPELNEVLRELNSALSEHTRRLRAMAADSRFPTRRKEP
jgi:hypothetical protein